MEGETIPARREGAQHSLHPCTLGEYLAAVGENKIGCNSPVGFREGGARFVPAKLEGDCSRALPAPGNESPSRFLLLWRVC